MKIGGIFAQDGQEFYKSLYLSSHTYVVTVTLLLSLSLLATTAFGIDWIPLDCGNGDPRGDQTPKSADLVGDLTGGNNYWTAAIAYDSGYLYFAERVDGNPGLPKIFDQYAWVALMQTPSGSRFQYQYEIALNGIGPGGGKNDTVELWNNSPASDIDWTPIFNDPADTLKWSNDYALGGPNIAPYNGKLATYTTATSSIGGDQDYIVYWSIPIQVLISNGVISSFSDLSSSLFFLATSTNPNNYNKDRIDCPFGPSAALNIVKDVSPSNIGKGCIDEVIYSINVSNPSHITATGVVVEDADFSACLSFTTANVTVNPSSGAQVVTAKPLKVKIDSIPAGGHVKINITANVTSCALGTYVNKATAYATNAKEVNDTATLVISEPRGCISGYKIDNCTDLGIGGWTISLYNNTGVFIDSNTTDANGKYEFCGLKPGDYEVRETLKSGWTNVTPANISVKLVCGDITNRNFSNTACQWADAGNDTIVCSGVNATLTGNATHFTSVKWNKTAGCNGILYWPISGQSLFNATYKPPADEEHCNLTFTAIGPCENATDNATVFVVKTPSADIRVIEPSRYR